MKIRVTVTLNVDPDEWEREYGVERDMIRTDVALWAENTLSEQLESVGCRLEVPR